MKIIGENINEHPVKELGNIIYYTNSAGDLMPVVATNNNGRQDYIRLTSTKRLGAKTSARSTPNPQNKTGLQLWVKKNTNITNTTGRFTTWGDISTNANDLTGDDASPYVMLSSDFFALMDGVGAKFTLGTALSLSQFTISFVIKDQRGKLGVLTGKSSDANAFISTSYASGGSVTLSLASGEVYSTAAGVVPHNEDVLVTVIKDSSNTLFVRVNATQVYTTTAASTALQIDQIGKLGSSTDTFMGNIYEICIYNTALTGDDLSTVELGLKARNRIA